MISRLPLRGAFLLGRPPVPGEMHSVESRGIAMALDEDDEAESEFEAAIPGNPFAAS